LAAFADLTWGLDVPKTDLGRWLVYFGMMMAMPAGLRRIDRLRPLVLPAVVTGAAAMSAGLLWSVAMYVNHPEALRSLISSLIAAGLFNLAASFTTRSPHPAALGLPLLAAAGHFTLVYEHARLELFAPYYAIFAAIVGLCTVSTRKRAEFLTTPGSWVASAAACVAMILMVSPGLRTIYYTHEEALGLLTSLGAAVAFGCTTMLTRSRFMSDITYFALGGVYAFALKLAGVGPQWMGIAGAALAGFFFVLAERVKGIFMRPSLFVALACAAGSLVYGEGL
jgi:hypothetical protein